MHFTGTLKSWNDDRGFGFIEATQGGPEIFVHIKAFPAGRGRPLVGQQLTFSMNLLRRAPIQIIPWANLVTSRLVHRVWGDCSRRLILTARVP